MLVKCVQITVKGKVQGVFFRKFTKITADQLTLSGVVKNLPDGSVYIEACGSSDAIEKFIQWCYSGPDGANVTSVEVTEILVKAFEKFEINYF